MKIRRRLKRTSVADMTPMIDIIFQLVIFFMISSVFNTRNNFVQHTLYEVIRSTLFNRFLRERKAITDPTPGVTRDPIESQCIIGNRQVLLIDTGGFKLERDDEFDELVSLKSIEMIGQADLILFLMDVNEITPEDEAFIELLRKYEEKVLVVA